MPKRKKYTWEVIEGCLIKVKGKRWRIHFHQLNREDGSKAAVVYEGGGWTTWDKDGNIADCYQTPCETLEEAKKAAIQSCIEHGSLD